jgi:hypothetical protein
MLTPDSALLGSPRNVTFLHLLLSNIFHQRPFITEKDLCSFASKEHYSRPLVNNRHFVPVDLRQLLSLLIVDRVSAQERFRRFRSFVFPFQNVTLFDSRAWSR